MPRPRADNLLVSLSGQNLLGSLSGQKFATCANSIAKEETAPSFHALFPNRGFARSVLDAMMPFGKSGLVFDVVRRWLAGLLNRSIVLAKPS